MNRTGSASKKETSNKKNKKRRNNGKIAFIVVVVALVLIIGGLLLYPSLTPGEKITEITPVAHPSANGLSLGNKNAPVTVIEFADFQCPYCQSFVQNMEASIETSYIDTGKVYFTYSPFSFIGNESVSATEAAYCANDQGKFWDYHDILFANQGTENTGAFSDSKLKAFAKSLGLDMNAFNSCYSSKKYAQTVQDDNNLATQDKVNSTPSFLVNGTLVNMSELQSAIENALAGATATPAK